MSSDDRPEAADSRLRSYTSRPPEERQRGQLRRPQLDITIGTDSRSSGFSVTAWMPTGGNWPSLHTLYWARWQSPVESVEEAVLLALRGLQAYAEEAGYVTP